MSQILRGKTFIFFIAALILILWYSADKEQRKKVLELRNDDSFISEPALEHQNKSALSFAQDQFQSLQIPIEQLQPPLSESETQGDHQTYQFSQVLSGYPLYESSLIFQWDQEAQEFQILENSLKKVEEASVNSRYSEQEVLEVLKTTYQDFEVAKPIGKQIYVEEGRGELAYKMIIEIPNKGSREVLMSALTSEILIDKKKVP